MDESGAIGSNFLDALGRTVNFGLTRAIDAQFPQQFTITAPQPVGQVPGSGAFLTGQPAPVLAGNGLIVVGGVLLAVLLVALLVRS